MSHFCVYVFHDENTSVEDLLAPYDENLKLPEPVVQYTKEQAIAKVRKDIEHYKNTIYAEYLKNPEAYEAKWGGNKSHINYLKVEFPKRLNWTDEECYKYIKKDYEPWDEDDDEPSMIAENGDLLTTYNPKSKWDWWTEGGRWSDLIENDEVKVKDIKPEDVSTPYAFVTTDGEWIERGRMGWFGCSSGDKTKEDWDKEFQDYLKSLDGNIIITNVDCHI